MRTRRGAAVPELEPRVLDCTEADPKTLFSYFEQSWQLYESLFSSVESDRTLYLAPDPLRHPLIFYFGHTAAFYANKLRLAGLVDTPVEPLFEELFARGVDPGSPEELSTFEWPTANAVRRYRERVHHLVAEVIFARPANGEIVAEDPLWAVLMGIEHDRIHFETSSVLIRQLPVDSVVRPEGWRYANPEPSAPEPMWVALDGGEVIIGKPSASHTYGWDNEWGRDLRKISPFSVRKDLTTNAEMRCFVEDGGYRQRELWSEEGWAWREKNDVDAPKFWRDRDGSFFHRAMFDELALPESWPAEVTCHEAEAFCRWLGEGHRLPSEAEWQHMLDCCDEEARRDATASYNLHMRFGSPCPVGLCDQGTDRKVHDVRGNVWQWLSDDFHPLPGFETNPLYPDFSSPFFDTEHAMLRGGAWATTGAGATAAYRLWFRRGFHQHAGFRVVRSEDGGSARSPSGAPRLFSSREG